MPKSRGRVMAGLRVLMGVIMVAGGLAKVVGEPHQVARFSTWGLPRWLRLVGTFEALGGLLLLMPESAPIGSLVLSTIMVGAHSTHGANGQWLHLIAAGVPSTITRAP